MRRSLQSKRERAKGIGRDLTERASSLFSEIPAPPLDAKKTAQAFFDAVWQGIKAATGNGKDPYREMIE